MVEALASPTMIPPPEWTPTNREYHALTTSWSPSMLSLFAESPRRAWAAYVARQTQPEPPTPAMAIGSLVNAILLQTGEPYHVAEGAKIRRGKAWDAALEDHPDELVVTGPEYETALGTVAAVLAPQTRMAEVAHHMLTKARGYSEYAYQWAEEAHGVPCKMMLDRLCMVAGEPCYVELKTTYDPTPESFSRSAIKFRYHVQLAHNLRGCLRCLRGLQPGCYVVAIRNSPPHEVWVYQVPIELLILGEQQLYEDWRRLSDCLVLDPGEPWCSEEERCVRGALPRLDPPPWMLKELRSVINTF